MSDTITIRGTFTSSNAPVSGLVLADVRFYLNQIHKQTGVALAVWNGSQSAEDEEPNIGAYKRRYVGADLDNYHYTSMLEYVGATVVDSEFVYGSISARDQVSVVSTGCWFN